MVEEKAKKVEKIEKTVENESASYMVELTNVSKGFKKKQVISNLTMQLERGMIHGFVGYNGSGKTVLMKLISGFLRADEGEILVDGKRIGMDVDFPENMGIIIENPGFISYETGYRNLLNLAAIRNRIDKEQVREAIEKLGLDSNLKTVVGKYSLGMRQRLGIAQAIMENPDLLILDEPMNGLDKAGVELVRNLLIELRKQGKTIIIASHMSEDIELLCNHVWEFDHSEVEKIK